MKLDKDLKEAMERDIKRHPDKANAVRMYYEGVQIERNRLKEYPCCYELNRYYLNKLTRSGIDFKIHKDETVVFGKKKIHVFTVGFKTESDFHKAMKFLGIE